MSRWKILHGVQHSPLELLREISNLKARGLRLARSQRRSISPSVRRCILNLLTHGEDAACAVEKGRIPLSSQCRSLTLTRAGIQQGTMRGIRRQDLTGRKLLYRQAHHELRKPKGSA